MATKARMTERATDSKNLLKRLTSHISTGSVHGLFEDDYFITDVIKVLYEDGLDFRDKMEILGILEQEVSELLDTNIADQVITALMDMFSDICHNSGNISIASQLLITITTIFIDHDDYLESQLCVKFISVMVDLLKKINNIPNRRLRATACHCLGQIEAWKSGTLWKWKDTLNKLAREERTDVCQDYVQLLVTIMNSSLGDAAGSMDGKDILPVVSYAMENTFYLTSCGILAILYPVIRLVQNSERISPTIFKPLMLQYMPSNDVNIMCLMLHIQNQLKGDMLSMKEEKILLCRNAEYINHACFPTNSRLLMIHWLRSYIEQLELEEIVQVLAMATRPSVFHPLEVHTCWLALHLLCKGLDGSQEISKDLFYLTQLAETTGGIRVTCCLYYLLYLQVFHHSSDAVQTTSLRITRSLFQTFPHLIPLVVDFLQAVKTSRPEKMFHQEILSLLDRTVLSLPLKLLLDNYQNYLQVWILSSQDPNMNQQRQLRCLLDLVQEATNQAVDDWALGSLILLICRSMMLHHHTDTFYPQMGDLLYYMMSDYGELDIRDQARFFYALLTLSSDDKTKEMLNANIFDSIQLGENIAQILPGSTTQSMPSEIRELDQPPVLLKRSQICVTFDGSPTHQAVEDSSHDFTGTYRKQLSNVKTHVECHLSASIISGKDYNDLIAVSFKLSDEKKEPLCDDVHIPFMLKEASTAILFRLSPSVPEPLFLHPSTIFSHERITFQCELPAIQLHLEDFLVPFPWQLFSFSKKWTLFEGLWQECTVGSSGACQGVESVKILRCKLQALCQKWKNALVHAETDQLCQRVHKAGTAHFLFFMPPSYHLLFQADSRTNDVVLKIASDFPLVFQFLDDYLESL